MHECKNNILITTSLFLELGFIVHKDKSVLNPTKEIVLLGNVINSETMTLMLPIEKKLVITSECEKLLNKYTAKIREVARVLGLIVSSFSAVDYGKLFYREIEKAKISALKKSCGDFESHMKITLEIKEELSLWLSNIFQAKILIRHNTPKITI